jgi:hypothetical protein
MIKKIIIYGTVFVIAGLIGYWLALIMYLMGMN